LKKRSKNFCPFGFGLSPTGSAQTRKSFLVLFFKKEPLTYLLTCALKAWELKLSYSAAPATQTGKRRGNDRVTLNS
jgi:hypothetical protein